MTTAVSLAPAPVFKAFDNNGLPLFNGQLFTYVAGSSTPQATYVDSTGTTPNTNPIILNARGECNLWLASALSYKLVLQDLFGNQIWSVDNIPGGITVAQITAILTQAIIGGILYPQTAAESSAGVTPINYFWQPGYTYRYGAVGDGITSDDTALQNSIKVGLQSGQKLYMPATPGAGYKISTALAITGPINIQGDGISKSCLYCNGCDGFNISAGVAQVMMQGFRINQAVRYTTTTNTLTGIHSHGTTGSQCNGHIYRDILIDGFQTAIEADGAANWDIDNCSCVFGFNGIVAQQISVNVRVRGGLYQCGTGSAQLAGSTGIQVGDGNSAAQGWMIDQTVTFGFDVAIWLNGANYCNVAYSILDFCYVRGVLVQAGTNASTNNTIAYNYIASTAAASTGIYLVNSVASSTGLGNRIVGNMIFPYAASSWSYGIYVGAAQEKNNIIRDNATNATTADCRIQFGTGHIVDGNNWLGAGFTTDPGIRVIYANNQGIMLSNPNASIFLPAFSVIQSAPTWTAGANAIDLNTGNSFVFSVTAGGAFSITNPINVPASGGERIRVRISNASGGALGAVTWGALYKTPAGISYPATGFNRTYEYELGTSGGNYCSSSIHRPSISLTSMAAVTNNALSRSLGSLEARMDSTEERLKRMEDKIDTLVETVAASKGGLRTLLAVSSIVAGATAGVSELIHWLSRSH